MVYVVNYDKADQEELAKGNGRMTKVKYLIDHRQGADNFYLRVYDVLPGGQTPYDQHQHEHEVFVLKGRAKLLTKENDRMMEREVGEGDAVFIRSNEVHQFVNESGNVFRMLCVRGGEKAGKIEEEAAPGAC